MKTDWLLPRLQAALAARIHWLEGPHQRAFRLFNGFYEGAPWLSIDIYARTALLHNYARQPQDGWPLVHTAASFLRQALPWLQTGLVKIRHGRLAEQQGILLWGHSPDRRLCENGVRYALALQLNRDPSFYLDTRSLRRWAKAHLAKKTVLNTFAYTGSLGVAATAGGARRVVHTDRNRRFLNVAKDSYTLNGFPIHKGDFITADFFKITARLRREKAQFDCIFLDPPFFALSPNGRVDWGQNPLRLLNKVRPLVAPGGWLVAINNALYLSGQAYLQTLHKICASGHFTIETLLPIDADFTGPAAPAGASPRLPADPSPFNHPTKIAILRRSA